VDDVLDALNNGSQGAGPPSRPSTAGGLESMSAIDIRATREDGAQRLQSVVGTDE